MTDVHNGPSRPGPTCRPRPRSTSAPVDILNGKNTRTSMSPTEVENETRKPLSELVLCDEDLLYVSEQVTEWRKLLRHLFVSDSKCDVHKEIEELEERQHQKSLQSCDCTRHALEIWRRRRGSRAVASDLLDVLVRIGRTDVKEGLELLVGGRKSLLTGRV